MYSHRLRVSANVGPWFRRTLSTGRQLDGRRAANESVVVVVRLVPTIPCHSRGSSFRWHIDLTDFLLSRTPLHTLTDLLLIRTLFFLSLSFFFHILRIVVFSFTSFWLKYSFTSSFSVLSWYSSCSFLSLCSDCADDEACFCLFLMTSFSGYGSRPLVIWRSGHWLYISLYLLCFSPPFFTGVYFIFTWYEIAWWLIFLTDW